MKEDRGKAVYHAIKSNDRELVKHLLMILTSGDIEIEFFKELETLLSRAYEGNVQKSVSNRIFSSTQFSIY